MIRLTPLTVLLVVIAPHACGEIRLLAVTSSASFVQGVPAPGSLATAFCTGLTGFDGILTASAPLPFSLAGVQVSVGGKPAPILALANLGGYQQINFQVPWEASSNGEIAVALGSDRGTLIPPVNLRWDVLFVDAAGSIVAQHASDYRPVTTLDPARPGEWIITYATNLGAVDHTPATGFPALADPLSPLHSPYDTFTPLLSGQSLTTNYMGLAPGMVGLYQINVRMPDTFSGVTPNLMIQKVRDCGFFFDPLCGRGVTITTSLPATLPVKP